MTTESRRGRSLTWSLRLGALASAIVLTGCGLGLSSTAPASDPFGPPPGTSPTPVARPTSTQSVDQPVPVPRAELSPTSTPSNKTASPGASTKAKAWVGTFHGHKIRVPQGHGAHVSLTFDDGPSPRYTPQVLALLAQHDTPAVFCVIGQQAQAYPKLVRKEVEAGHVLCDHSRDHDLAMNRRGRPTSPTRSTTASPPSTPPLPAPPCRSTASPAGPGHPRSSVPCTSTT